MSLWLFFVGTILSLAYAILGIFAIRHIEDKKERDASRFSWAFWWWVNQKKYDPKGKRMCNIGLAIFIAMIITWFNFFIKNNNVSS